MNDPRLALPTVDDFTDGAGALATTADILATWVRGADLVAYRLCSNFQIIEVDPSKLSSDLTDFIRDRVIEAARHAQIILDYNINAPVASVTYEQALHERALSSSQARHSDGNLVRGRFYSRPFAYPNNSLGQD